jgi:hypothetical protein
MNPASEIFAWSILLATFLGPIAAVLVTRYVDRLRQKYDRRLYIFRTLMATRRSNLSPEHIAAFNQIELDFQNDPDVMTPYRALMKHLNTPFDYAKENNRVARERQSLRTKILSAMAKNLHIRVEQLEILEGGYMPQGHVDVEREQTAIRRLLTEIADGKRSFPVQIHEDKPSPRPRRGA